MKTDVNKSFFFLLLALLLGYGSYARHIAGGEMSYEYLGLSADGTSLRYRITLRLYRDCLSTGAPLDDLATITIREFSPGTYFNNKEVPLEFVDSIRLKDAGPCIDNPPIVCYQVGVYHLTVDLPMSPTGYSITYQRCCRINGITNVINSANVGATYTANIPGTNVLPDAPKNSSPKFGTSDTVVICENNSFVYDFGATDKEGDALSYFFAEAYDGATNSDPQPTVAAPPPYYSLQYAFGYNKFRPMGPDVTLDSKTGLITGVAPSAGIYVITVTVVEVRQSKVINVHRKDLHIKVAPCSIAAASLRPEYISCDDYTVYFENLSKSPLIVSYSWDFGVKNSNSDTSNLEKPNFTYPDTGVYTIRLITNRGQDCSDTAYSVARVFPGFVPDFFAQIGCKQVPVQFQDQTKATYGVPNEWQWSFGDPLINPETSTLQNPEYTYPDEGDYNVQLIVASSKGCRDTIEKTINVLSKPPIQLLDDTLICDIDTLQLNAMGIGTFSWTPNYNISNLNIPNPLVSPDKPTWYYVHLSTAPGCENVDSVFVNVKSFVTIDAGNDTTICLTDSLRLNPATDALGFSWTPTSTLNDPLLKNPIAIPTSTTTYTVVGNIGKCIASDDVTVQTVPYPTVSTSADTSICYGDFAQLFATGGKSYLWIPANGLNSNQVSNPIASPEFSTLYVVAVTDNQGCPKPTFDSVFLRVVPPVPAFAGNDTAIVLDQPLQLQASGGEFYVWTPSTGLNNPNISDPVAQLTDDITYTVRAYTEEGCFADDTMHVKVFKTPPDIFVPTAFTPNGDNLNDRLTPIPVGIAEFDYFRVYNRWGELVFSTTEVGKGWDGKISGKDQGSDSFAWYVRGVDYTGKIIFKKGTSTLIR